MPSHSAKFSCLCAFDSFCCDISFGFDFLLLCSIIEALSLLLCFLIEPWFLASVLSHWAIRLWAMRFLLLCCLIELHSLCYIIEPWFLASVLSHWAMIPWFCAISLSHDFPFGHDSLFLCYLTEPWFLVSVLFLWAMIPCFCAISVSHDSLFLCCIIEPWFVVSVLYLWAMILCFCAISLSHDSLFLCCFIEPWFLVSVLYHWAMDSLFLGFLIELWDSELWDSCFCAVSLSCIRLFLCLIIE